MESTDLIAHVVTVASTVAAIGFATWKGLNWMGKQVVFPVIKKVINRQLELVDKVHAMLKKVAPILDKLTRDEAKRNLPPAEAGKPPKTDGL